MVCREIPPPPYEGEDISPCSIYIALLSDFVLLSVLWWDLGVCSSWEKMTLTSVPTSNGLLGWAGIQQMVLTRDSFRGFCRKAYWVQAEVGKVRH